MVATSRSSRFAKTPALPTNFFPATCIDWRLGRVLRARLDRREYLFELCCFAEVSLLGSVSWGVGVKVHTGWSRLDESCGWGRGTVP